MPHISVLRKEISELIAAGEVIERPSSVIKEVVENAIDAGAKHITVEIQHGGTTYMRIVDDGCGMAAEEVPTAFLRHATSKISDKADLDHIFTLGFRGEALASIAAVAKVTVLTKRKEDDYGTSYSISGGVAEKSEQTGCPDGTTLLIRDLFYNVPVRQKFMKRDVTEANAVSQIVQKIALSHPEIAFRMIRDNRTEFRTDGSGDLYTAVYAILGKEFAHDLIPVSYQDGMNQVTGFVGKPLYSRSNRTFQNFFINGRYVRSRQCSVALENAYQNLIMVGKFPTCVLMLQVPPEQVDVNIHPAKAEVRFSNEKAVMDSLFFAVKNALMQNGLIYEFQMEHVPQHDWTAQPEPQQEFVQPALPTIEKTTEPLAAGRDHTAGTGKRDGFTAGQHNAGYHPYDSPKGSRARRIGYCRFACTGRTAHTDSKRTSFHSGTVRGKIRVPQRQCFCRKAKVSAGTNACKTSAEGTYQDPCAGRDFRKLHYR